MLWQIIPLLDSLEARIYKVSIPKNLRSCRKASIEKLCDGIAYHPLHDLRRLYFFFEPLFTMQTMLHGDGGLQSNVWLSEKIANSWGFFSGGFLDPLQSHSNGLCKDPNDCVNHSKLLFGSFETCSRHIRNYSNAENYFLRLDFRKLSPENE